MECRLPQNWRGNSPQCSACCKPKCGHRRRLILLIPHWVQSTVETSTLTSMSTPTAAIVNDIAQATKSSSRPIFTSYGSADSVGSCAQSHRLQEILARATEFSALSCTHWMCCADCGIVGFSLLFYFRCSTLPCENLAIQRLSSKDPGQVP